jgi:transposase
VQRLLKQLQSTHPHATFKCCYEAGPRGFPLVRFIRSLGHECIVVCPSHVPRRPGDRVKTDRRDADQLARLHRAGELKGIHVPEPEDEAMRDFLRSRDQVRRARQQLKMFCCATTFVTLRLSPRHGYEAEPLGFTSHRQLVAGQSRSTCMLKPSLMIGSIRSLHDINIRTACDWVLHGS